MTAVVLDAWALLAWIGEEQPAVEDVEQLIGAAARGENELFISIINLGEVFYRSVRKYGRGRADEVRRKCDSLPIRVISADDDLVWEAAHLKSRYRLSYADAFAAGLALREQADLYTGDPEFKPLEQAEGLRVHWLSRVG